MAFWADRSMRGALGATLWTLVAFASPRQGADAKSIQACRTTEPIRLDGRLDEAAWELAPTATGFTEMWPEFGKPAKQPTDVKVLYDDAFLYVGARMHHERGRSRVVKRLHRRDQDSSSDWFGVYVDSLRDRRTALAFFVNAAGVQRDGLLTGDNGMVDTSWDGVWECATRVDAKGWTVEYKIPLSLFRIHPGGGPQTWAINFSRSDQGPLRGSAFWYQGPRGENAFVSRFPDLTGIRDVEPKPRREWTPYLSLQRKFETAQSFDDREWKLRAGLDARLGLNGSGQLDLTLHPDFGQVEVDQQVLNLSTLETFFPEKRPFFLEGMEIFQVAGQSLLYSRRIGTSLYPPTPGEGESLRSAPLVTDISAAAKYTVKREDGWNFGFLGASVNAAHADLVNAGGQDVRREVYPFTSFGVARAQKRLDDRGSYLGLFAGGMRQAASDGREARILAADSVLRDEAQRGRLEMSIAGSEAGTRDQAGLAQGWRSSLRGNYQWPSAVSVDLSMVNATRDYNPNDLGFLQRADEQSAALTVRRQVDGEMAGLQNWYFSGSVTHAQDQAGKPFQRSVSASLGSETRSFFSLWGGGGVALPVYDDRELRTFGDPSKKYLRVARNPWVNVGFDTPGNKPYGGMLNLSRRWFEGGPSSTMSLSQFLRVGEALEFTFQTELGRGYGERKYVHPADGQSGYVFDGVASEAPLTGLRRLSQLSQTLRVAYAFTPRMSLQALLQWLDASWQYRDLKRYADDRTLVPVGSTDAPLSASDRCWNVNLISRWEFRPGSTFFVVYSHGVASDALANTQGSLGPCRDLSYLHHLPSDDAVQMKVSWLFR